MNTSRVRRVEIVWLVVLASSTAVACFDFEGFRLRSQGASPSGVGSSGDAGNEATAGEAGARFANTGGTAGENAGEHGGAVNGELTGAHDGTTMIGSVGNRTRNEDAGRAGRNASGEGGAAGTDHGGEGGASRAGAEAGDSAGGEVSHSECASVEPDMKCIPHGTFVMGTNEASYPSAMPAHLVNVTAFQLDVTEVTVQSYRACADAGYCGWADVSNNLGDPNSVCNAALDDHDQYPVDCVSLFDAARFCAWRGKRLPREEEWEYAAQRPGGRKYPWGADEASVARLNGCGTECNANSFPWDDGYPGPAPVGSFPAGNSFDGLSDLAGNVWEWTQTLNCPYSFDTCDACDGGTPGCTSPCNATCPEGSPVARGGASGSLGNYDFRVVERGVFNAYNQWPGIGFRCTK